MAFQWEEYILLAEYLSEDPDDEAALRAAVSRAYYAAFHIAKNFLSKNGIQISEYKASIHHEVWNAFNNRGIPWSAVYRYGDALMKRRRNADYYLPPYPDKKPKNWPEEAKHSIDEANQVLERVQEISEKPSDKQ